MDVHVKLEDLYTVNLDHFDSVHLIANGSTYALRVYKRPLKVQGIQPSQQAERQVARPRLEVSVSAVDDVSIHRSVKEALGGQPGNDGWLI